MRKKPPFGHYSARDIEIGDLIKWTKWNPEREDWDEILGVVIDMEDTIRSGRLVSITRVVSMQHPQTELEFFTMSLKLVSKGFNKSKD